MRTYAVCLISLIGVVLVYGQTTAPKICWDSKWYNDSVPTSANRSDYETQPAKVLNSICRNGKVISAQCRDQKGEPFTGFKNDSVNHYIATCYVVTGLICNPYNNTKELCADFEIQYGCACPKTGTPGGGATPPNLVGSGQGASVSSTTDAIGTAGQQHGQCGNGAQRYGISQFMLMTCIILKVLG